MYLLIVSRKEMGEVPPDERQRFSDHVKVAWHAVRELGMTFKPKKHALSHMMFQMSTSGSPYSWGCWRDETCNMALRKVARAAHRLVWHRRILNSHRASFGKKLKRRLRSR